MRTTPALRVIGLVAALFLLNASLTFVSAWPTPGVLWHGALSIELANLAGVIRSERGKEIEQLGPTAEVR